VSAPDQRPASEADPGLLDRRDQLVERFVRGQSDLGGLYYEMAIRGHVRDEVLMRKAAELQRIDVELAQVERLLRGEDVTATEPCPSCGSSRGRADRFCSQCGHAFTPVLAVNGTNGTAPAP